MLNEALVRQHRPLVRRIARSWKRHMPRAELEDLEQAGMIGLIEAAARFRGENGAGFETFVGHRISGAMLDSVRDGDWTPRRIARAVREIVQAIRAIEVKEQRPAREVEIAEALGLAVEAYRRLLAETSARHVFSFDEAPNALAVESAYTAPNAAAEEAQTTSALDAAIATLPEREQLIIKRTFFDGATLTEVGRELGVTESRVCQLRSQAMARLRAKLEDLR